MDRLGNEAYEVWRQIVDFFTVAFVVLWNATIVQLQLVLRLLPDIQALPIWKQVMLLVVFVALAMLIWFTIVPFIKLLWDIIEAFADFLRSIALHVLFILGAALITFGGAWAINNMTMPWLP